jgi:hypothetical protein
MLYLDLLHPEKEGKKAAGKHPDTTRIKFRPQLTVRVVLAMEKERMGREPAPS